MFAGLKRAFVPSVNKTAPLKSATGEIIIDRSKHIKRWAKHYEELYSWENSVSGSAVRNTKSLTIMEELNVPPTMEELAKAIDTYPVAKLQEITAFHEKSSRLAKECSP